MTTKNITKIIFAFILTVAVTCGSGVVEQEIGVSITNSVYAGGSCVTGGGGGC